MGLLTISREEGKFRLENQKGNKWCEVTTNEEKDMFTIKSGYISNEVKRLHVFEKEKARLEKFVEDYRKLVETDRNDNYYHTNFERCKTNLDNYVKKGPEAVSEWETNESSVTHYAIEKRKVFESITIGLFSDHPVDKEKFKKSYAREQVRKRLSTNSIKVHNSRICDELKVLEASMDKDSLAMQKVAFSSVGPEGFAPVFRRAKDGLAVHKNKEYIKNDLMKYSIPWLFVKNSYGSFDTNWMSKFSQTGKVYGNLAKTLSSVKGGGIPLYELKSLIHVKLERAMNKSELRTFAKYVASRHEFRITRNGRGVYNDWGPDEEDGYNYNPNHLPVQQNDVFQYHRHYRVFMFATPKEIKRCAMLVGATQRRKFDLRKKNDLQQLISYIADYPEDHDGKIVGLCEKSIKWHRENYRLGFNRNMARYNKDIQPETKTALPPIPLPDKKEIVFLDTVAAVEEEGSRMNHCVAQYAGKAVQGRCYLFHIDHEGQWATVEVDAQQATVVQCYAPKNSKNKATTFGEKAIKNWCSKLRKHLLLLTQKPGEVNVPVQEAMPF